MKETLNMILLNITKEEIELLNQGQRLHANFANKKPHRNPTYNGPSSPNSFDIDNIFANEIAELRSKVGEANNFEDIVNNNDYIEHHNELKWLESVGFGDKELLLYIK